MAVNSEYPDCPRVAVGAVVFKEGRILLVRRGKAPAEGMWSIPGGSVNLGESLQQAAEREIIEETGVTIKARREPILTFDVVRRDDNGRIRFHYVIVDFEAEWISGEPRAGDDAVEARWVRSEELEALAVSPATRKLLKQKYGIG